MQLRCDYSRVQFPALERVFMFAFCFVVIVVVVFFLCFCVCPKHIICHVILQLFCIVNTFSILNILQDLLSIIRVSRYGFNILKYFQ